MDQVTKAKAFADLHVKGSPLVLWNVWDAGSAKAVADDDGVFDTELLGGGAEHAGLV